MTALTWRQFRVQATVIITGLVTLGVLLAVTGPRVASLYDAGREGFLSRFTADDLNNVLYAVGMAAVYVLPVIIGAFWGAPLVARELEAGTHRLVWNQSVTRIRWLATKLGLTGLAAMAATGLLSLAMTWWCAPLDRAVNNGSDDNSLAGVPRLNPFIFSTRGIVPIGYVALAFVLGVLAGMLIRRTVPAMAVTLAVFGAIQIVVPLWVTPHLIAPTELVSEITPANIRTLMADSPDGPVRELGIKLDEPGARILTNQTVDGAGDVAGTVPNWALACMPRLPTQASRPPEECARLTEAGYRQHVTYQPASRYWALQWFQTALFLALALLLSGVCFWRIRRLS